MKGELTNMTRAWEEEKSESPTRIEPMTSRTPNSVKRTLLFMSSRSSVDRAPSWCSRGHGFVFLCSTLVPYWSIHLAQFCCSFLRSEIYSHWYIVLVTLWCLFNSRHGLRPVRKRRRYWRRVSMKDVSHGEKSPHILTVLRSPVAHGLESDGN